MKGMFAGRMVVLLALAFVAAGCSRAGDEEQEVASAECDKACLEDIAAQYRAAYLAQMRAAASKGS